MKSLSREREWFRQPLDYSGEATESLALKCPYGIRIPVHGTRHMMMPTLDDVARMENMVCC